MQKKFLLWGLFFGTFAVILGAFGAHALKQHLSISQLNSFETGVRYQMYHALLLILIGNFSFLQSRIILNLLISGIFLFSFSIYLLNLKELLGFDFLKYLGPITPVGGTLIITCWLFLLYKVFQRKE